MSKLASFLGLTDKATMPDTNELDTTNDSLTKEVSETKDFVDNASDVDDNVYDDDMKNVPNIDLGPVSELQNFLSGLTYDEVRVGLYHKYGLLVRDEPSIPGVYMITYEKMERSNPGKKKVELTEEEQGYMNEYRGVIVEKDTNKPLCYTFNKMLRHLPDDWKLEDCKVTESCDGSQIKVFYYEKEGYWVVSTTRRIDASKSYFFSNKSFMEMFQESSSVLNWDRLNKECCYSFVMAHPENRVVKKHDHPSLIHVLTRNMKTLKLVNDDVGIQKALPANFNEKADMWKAVRKLSYWKEGFVVYHQPTQSFVKVINKKYQEVKNLRGSSSSLLYHYFDLKKKDKISHFLKYYPEFKTIFNYFEDCFNNLCLLTFNEYISLRVRKTLQQSDVLRPLKPVLFRIHGVHLTKHVRIRLADVREHLEEYHPSMLRKLVDMANGLPYSYI